jgi:O-antigen ligase
MPTSIAESAGSRRDAAQVWLIRVLAASLGLFGPLIVFLPRATAPLLIATAVISVGITVWLKRGLSLPRAPWVLPAAVFIGYASLSVFWAPILGDGLAQAAAFLLVFVPFLGLMGLLPTLPETARRRIEMAFLLGFALSFPIFLTEAMLDQPIYRLIKGIASEVEVNQNLINRSAVLYSLAAWPAALILYRHGYRGLAHGLPVAVLAAMLVATYSMAAQFGTLAGLLLLPLAIRSTRVTRLLLIVLVIAGFAGAIGVSRGLGALGAVDMTGLTSSIRHRVEIWDFTAQRIMEQPIFGHGLDASRHIDNHGAVTRFNRPGAPIIPLHPHNMFLQVWLELGTVGAVFGAWMLGAVILATRRLDPPTQRFVLPAAGATLFMQSTSFGAWQTWWVCGILLMVLVFSIVAREHETG